MRPEPKTQKELLHALNLEPPARTLGSIVSDIISNCGLRHFILIIILFFFLALVLGGGGKGKKTPSNAHVELPIHYFPATPVSLRFEANFPGSVSEWRKFLKREDGAVPNQARSDVIIFMDRISPAQMTSFAEVLSAPVYDTFKVLFPTQSSADSPTDRLYVFPAFYSIVSGGIELMSAQSIKDPALLNRLARTASRIRKRYVFLLEASVSVSELDKLMQTVGGFELVVKDSGSGLMTRWRREETGNIVSQTLPNTYTAFSGGRGE